MISILVMACVYTGVLTGLFVFLVISMQRSWAQRVQMQDEARGKEMVRLQRALEETQKQCHSAYAIIQAVKVRGDVHLPLSQVAPGTPPKFSNGRTPWSQTLNRSMTGAGMPTHFANEEGTGMHGRR